MELTCFICRAKQQSVVVEVNLRTPAWRIVERALCLFDLEVGHSFASPSSALLLLYGIQYTLFS